MSAKPDAAAEQLGKGLFDQMSRQFPDMNDVLWLIDNGASLSVTDRDGLTPLLRAMSWGNTAVIRAMITHGADVNQPGGRHQVTPMQIAASGGDADLVRLLLDAGGDVLKQNAVGRNALDLARFNADAGVLPMLEAAAKPQLEARAAGERHQKAIRDGLPVEKPFPPLKPLRFRP